MLLAAFAAVLARLLLGGTHDAHVLSPVELSEPQQPFLLTLGHIRKQGLEIRLGGSKIWKSSRSYSSMVSNFRLPYTFHVFS